MGKVVISKYNLTDIANAIREKTGTTNKIKTKDMVEAMKDIYSPWSLDEFSTSFLSVCGPSRGSNCTMLPKGITSIGQYAFYKHPNLALTTLPDSVTSIGYYSFAECTNIKLTKLPDSITSIGSFAFYNCTNLALAKLPNSLTTIGSYAFDSCDGLTLTELPSGLTSIGIYAFQYCDNITFQEIPSGVTVINEHVFSGCDSLPALTLRGNITKIGNYAFQDSPCMTNLYLPNVTSVPTLGGTSAFGGTPIADGTGYVYVPSSLVNSFKTATNWTRYASQIRSI